MYYFLGFQGLFLQLVLPGRAMRMAIAQEYYPLHVKREISHVNISFIILHGYLLGNLENWLMFPVTCY